MRRLAGVSATGAGCRNREAKFSEPPSSKIVVRPNPGPDRDTFEKTELKYLQRLQKIDQILHLLRAETYLKALIVEVHYLRQIGGGAIVKVRSARGESA